VQLVRKVDADKPCDEKGDPRRREGKRHSTKKGSRPRNEGSEDSQVDDPRERTQQDVV